MCRLEESVELAWVLSWASFRTLLSVAWLSLALKVTATLVLNTE